MNQREKLWTLLQQNYKINFELISQVNTLITVKLMGGAKKSFSTDKIVLEKNTSTINELISHLMEIKPKDTLEFDTNNLLIAVNGIDSSALQGYDTKLNSDDEISIIPIIHGGSSHRIQFSVAQSNVELFDILFDKQFHRDFLDELRNKHKQLIIQAINPQFLLSAQHAKKILTLSFKIEIPVLSPRISINTVKSGLFNETLFGNIFATSVIISFVDTLVFLFSTVIL